MWDGENLLELATLVTLWVLAVQYFVNFFVRGWLKDHYYGRRRMPEDQADQKVESFERKLRVAVVLTLTAAAVLGTVGWAAS